MSGVKIQLSPKEIEMASDPGLILTKNRIMDGVMELFGKAAGNATAYAESHKSRLPPEVFAHPPKISRGEQYRHLPWMMLDYPRLFDPPATLAIRHFFWWGHNFSVSLQVSGRFKEMVVDRKGSWPGDTYVCVHPSPWEHHFGTDNFTPFKELSSEEFDEMLQQKDFLKLALSLPVSQWVEAPAFLQRSYRSWMDLLLR